MHPILFQGTIGDWNLTLHAYGSFLVLAACAAGILFARGAASLGVRPARAAVGYVAALAAGLAGARMLDAGLNLQSYAAEPGRLFAVEAHGFALYGGLAAAAVVAAAWARYHGVQARRLADASVPAVAAGVALMRVGCFLNGCCHGVATDLPTGVVFPPRAAGLERDLLDGQIPLFGQVTTPEAVHPTQLYELAAVVVLALVAHRAARRGLPPGVAALLFAAGFLLFRAGNQVLRPVPPDATLPAAALVGIYLAAALGAAALLGRAWLIARRAGVAQIPAVASPST